MVSFSEKQVYLNSSILLPVFTGCTVMLLNKPLFCRLHVRSRFHFNTFLASTVSWKTCFDRTDWEIYQWALPHSQMWALSLNSQNIQVREDNINIHFIYIALQKQWATWEILSLQIVVVKKGKRKHATRRHIGVAANTQMSALKPFFFLKVYSCSCFRGEQWKN